MDSFTTWILGRTDACILDCKGYLMLIISEGLRGDGYGYGYIAFICELGGIGKQIDQNLPDPPLISTQ
jgi:hypothetical protein